MINKKILKFPKKKETMIVDEDNFPPLANVNVKTPICIFFLNERRRNAVRNKSFRPINAIRKCWVPNKMISEVRDTKTESFL